MRLCVPFFGAVAFCSGLILSEPIVQAVSPPGNFSRDPLTYSSTPSVRRGDEEGSRFYRESHAEGGETDFWETSGQKPDFPPFIIGGAAVSQPVLRSVGKSQGVLEETHTARGGAKSVRKREKWREMGENWGKSEEHVISRNLYKNGKNSEKLNENWMTKIGGRNLSGNQVKHGENFRIYLGENLVKSGQNLKHKIWQNTSENRFFAAKWGIWDFNPLYLSSNNTLRRCVPNVSWRGCPEGIFLRRLEDLKQLSDFTALDVLGLFLLSGSGILAVTVGVGGGGLFVPIMIVVMKFSSHEATALTHSLMTGGSSAGFLLNIYQRHPVNPQLPLINMDQVLLLGPLMIAGVTVGVLINSILPPLAINILMVFILSLSFLKTLHGLNKTRNLKNPFKIKHFQNKPLTTKKHLLPTKIDPLPTKNHQKMSAIKNDQKMSFQSNLAEDHPAVSRASQNSLSTPTKSPQLSPNAEVFQTREQFSQNFEEVSQKTFSQDVEQVTNLTSPHKTEKSPPKNENSHRQNEKSPAKNEKFPPKNEKSPPKNENSPPKNEKSPPKSKKSPSKNAPQNTIHSPRNSINSAQNFTMSAQNISNFPKNRRRSASPDSENFSTNSEEDNGGIGPDKMSRASYCMKELDEVSDIENNNSGTNRVTTTHSANEPITNTSDNIILPSCVPVGENSYHEVNSLLDIEAPQPFMQANSFSNNPPFISHTNYSQEKNPTFTQNSKAGFQEDEKLRPIYCYLPKNLFHKLLLALLVWSVNSTFALVRGNGNAMYNSRVEFCSARYWGLYALSICVLLAFGFVFSIRLARIGRGKRGDNNFSRNIPHPKMYTKQTILLWAVVGIVAGFVAGVIGVGGGMLLAPVMLARGEEPRVVAAVNVTLVLMSSSTAAILHLVSSHAHPMWTVVLGSTCFISALLGKSIVDHFVRQYQLSTLLVVLLLCIILLSILTMMVLGITSAVNDPEAALAFGTICG